MWGVELLRVFGLGRNCQDYGITKLGGQQVGTARLGNVQMSSLLLRALFVCLWRPWRRVVVIDILSTTG